MEGFFSSTLGVNVNNLGDLSNLSNLVDRVNQLKDNIERTLDSAVGEEGEEKIINQEADKVFEVKKKNETPSQVTSMKKEEGDEEGGEGEAIGIKPSETEATTTISIEKSVPPNNIIKEEEKVVLVEKKHNEEEEEEGNLIKEVVDEPQPLTSKEKELMDTLKRREAQLEKASRQLAEQEEQLNAFREASLEGNSSDKRIRAAEARAEGLMKEGLALAEKQGKAEQLLRKVRKEKEEIEVKEKLLSEALKKEQESKAILEVELNELRNVRKRGEASIAQITESSADSARKLEEARVQVLQAEKRETEMKVAMERTFSEVADQKKTITSLTQQLNSAKREAEHSKFQLKEQLDSRQIHGSRAESMEKSLLESKIALEEHIRESRQLEAELRNQLHRANEQFRNAEKRAEEASAKSVELTTPLLRQIDALNEQRVKNEQATSQLLTRAVTAEAAELEASASKRRIEQTRIELSGRISELETLLTSAKVDASRANSDYKISIKRAEEAERERDAIQKALDSLRASTDSKIADSRSTEMQLRQNLALEAEKFERMKRSWEEKNKELEELNQVNIRRIRQIETTGGGGVTTTDLTSPSPVSFRRPAPPPANNETNSVLSSTTTTQEEILGNALFGDDYNNNNSNNLDLTDSSPRFVLQASELQAGVRRRDAKIKVLIEQITSLTKQKDDLSIQVYTLQEKLKKFESLGEREIVLNKEIHNLKTQSSLLLELLGEKEEQIEAMTADMEDVKSKFREQIETFLLLKQG